MYQSAVPREIAGERLFSTLEQHRHGEGQEEDVPLRSPRALSKGSLNNIHSGVANSSGEIENKRPATGANRPNSLKKRKTESATCLPPELMTMVIKGFVKAEPRCALDLVVPDWNICPREAPEFEGLPRNTRIVTYIRGIGFLQVGSLSCKFDHGDKDHILTPMARLNANAAAVNKNFSLEYTTRSYRTHTHVFTLGIDHLPGAAVEELLGNDWRDLMPLRSERVKTILPFDDEPNNIIKMRSSQVPAPIYEDLRHIAVHSPLKLMEENAHTFGIVGDIDKRDKMEEALNNALDLDRSAHLWLSWSRMQNLESVFLDLRFYSHNLNTERRCLSKSQIIERAEEMGHHLQLRVLVLAGLQSYNFHVEYDGIMAHHIEEQDIIHDEPNWIKIFRPAIQEGGKIILVDKIIDNLFKP
ncbi:hypothetical protein E0Z10_g5669 [Xylaria hypoxylon]|uniref:Uncharacterized protein n=1 Tax=Xylaria hypoxylon TaxID=37992 RepID=A0A4Z0Z3A3_9PEZI|nr:hypothetical protein E0Z10_g5669 [Xylaria hypoxylon]